MFNTVINRLISFFTFVREKFSYKRFSKKRNKKQFRKIMNTLNLEERFTNIYNINYWNSSESISGVGSTLKATEKLRHSLPILFKKLSVHSIFDGPCGDFHWMRYVVNNADINYCGGDIVYPVIKENQSKYGSKKVKFIHIDLTKEIPPKADLMICRDCLFHLSFNDTKLLLNNFINSNISFLLTTTYENDHSFLNEDILTGHFRKIDLFSNPYHFSKDILFKIDDYLTGEHPRYMCLWSREQIIKAIADFDC
jgi:hypothetical protein